MPREINGPLTVSGITALEELDMDERDHKKKKARRNNDDTLPEGLLLPRNPEDRTLFPRHGQQTFADGLNTVLLGHIRSGDL